MNPPAPLTTLPQKRKMLIISNSQPYYSECGGYCLQMHYLMLMFQSRFQIYYYSVGLNDVVEGQLYNYQEFQAHLNATNEINATKLRNVANRRTYLKDIKYMAHRFAETIFINIDPINRLIKQENIDTTFFLGDVVIFSKNETTFQCEHSFLWYPCHYDPIPKGDLKGINMFKNVICLSPSLYRMIKTLQRNHEILDTIKVGYIPHIVKHIQIAQSKQEIRRKYNISDDKYVVLVNSTYYEDSERKNPEGTLVAFKEFLKTHPNSVLFIHSFLKDKVKLQFTRDVVLPSDTYPGKLCQTSITFGNETVNVSFVAENGSYPGKTVTLQFEKDLVIENKIPYPVDQLIDELGIRDNVIYHQEYLTYEELMELYVMSDVLLCASYAEGFGVPVLEAQLYGLPVITTKFMAMEDYNFNGYLIDRWQRKFNKGQHAFWVMPFTDAIVEGLQCVHDQGCDEGKGLLAQRIIQATMSYTAVSKEWLKIIG